jgi:hypothetical protein
MTTPFLTYNKVDIKNFKTITLNEWGYYYHAIIQTLIKWYKYSIVNFLTRQRHQITEEKHQKIYSVVTS